MQSNEADDMQGAAMQNNLFSNSIALPRQDRKVTSLLTLI